ncbi:MAG: short-chain fatty acid transporter [Flavobacteriales bacterium]|nr:short-chain fatty acid transporter [Flavobacteriales bacterium]
MIHTFVILAFHASMNSLLQRLGDFFAIQVRKVLPDSFVFAIILTLVTMGLALGLTDTGALELMGQWIGGLYSPKILTFGFFMMMILCFGYTMGDSRVMRNFFHALSKRIHRPTQVYLVITLSSLILNLINWGLAPVTALFTVELCKRVKGVDFRLACAALYSGMLVWHGGLSSSAAIMMASESTASVFIDAGLIEDVIPVTETLLHPLNIALIGFTLFILPMMILWIRPAYDPHFDAALRIQGEQDNEEVLDAATQEEESHPTWADRLNRAYIINIILAVLCVVGLVLSVQNKGFDLTALTLLMLTGALLLQGSPIRFVHVMKDAIKGASDIVVQFPLFGGIMGIFIGSGLAVIFADQLLSIGDGQSLPWLAFVCSSVVNLFIPSGGGEWLVLGPPLLEAAGRSGADIGKTIIAFAYGDSLTNLMNPFWTLTFLPIMGRLIKMETRDFMGYTVFLCLVFFVFESLIIWLV